MGGGAWQKNLPPGLELTDLSTVSYAGRGIWLHRGTDQYGRTWEYTEHRDGSREISYWDESGLFHEVKSYNGQWHDRYTDPNIGRQIETNTGVNGPPPQLPPGLVRQNPHTWPENVTDENGNPVLDANGNPVIYTHYRATDQYGREWDWYRDANGVKHVTYQDENGDWHEIRGPINGNWYDRSWANGEVTNLGQNGPPPRNLDEVGHAFLNNPDMTPEELKAAAEAAGRTPEDVEPKEGEIRTLPADPGEGGAQTPENTGVVPPWLRGEGTAPNIPGEEGEQTPENPGPVPPGDTGEPTYWSPMPYRVQDPTTGEWRFKIQDPVTGELRDPEPVKSPGPWVPEPNAPGPAFHLTIAMYTQDPATGEWRYVDYSELFDPSAPGPTLDPALFDPTAPGPTLDPGLFQLEILAWRDGVPRPDLNPWTGEKLTDPTTGEPYPDPVGEPATGYETMDIVFVEPDDPRLGTSPRYQVRDLVEPDEPNAPGPSIDPNAVYTADIVFVEPDDPLLGTHPRYQVRDLVEPDEPSVHGPTIDPALLDPNSPGPTIDPALLDPNSPGPTIEPALLDPNAPGETIDPNQLDPSAPGPTLDPAQLEQGIVEPSGFMEPAGVADHGFTTPSLAEQHPAEPHAPDHALDDHQPGMM